MAEWSIKRRLAMELLAGEGFRPDVDSDGDIRFKYEGRTYYILANSDDDRYIQMVCLGIGTMDGGSQLGAAMLAASKATRETKVAKVWPSVDMNRMNASVEIFCESWAALSGSILSRCVRALGVAVDSFQAEYRKIR
jgi:hypothetical protein